MTEIAAVYREAAGVELGLAFGPSGLLMERGEADIFLTYRTDAVRAAREVPGLEIVTVPETLAVGADYGLVLLTERPAAASLALFILSPAGQTILARHGFVAPTLPAAD